MATPRPRRGQQWTWVKDPLEGELDVENECLILNNHKELLERGLSEEKIICILNSIFAKDKVQKALKGL